MCYEIIESRFLGTPEFAKTSLEAIHQSHHHVVGVVTVADKASGRGQKINQSPVKVYAAENNIPVFQPEKLRNPEFLEELRKLDADVFVVVAFRMMPKILLKCLKWELSIFMLLYYRITERCCSHQLCSDQR